MSLMAVTFRVQQELKRSHRALDMNRHLLKIMYVIWSNGDGDEEDFILLTACCLDFTCCYMFTAEFLLWG